MLAKLAKSFVKTGSNLPQTFVSSVSHFDFVFVTKNRWKCFLFKRTSSIQTKAFRKTTSQVRGQSKIKTAMRLDDITGSTRKMTCPPAQNTQWCKTQNVKLPRSLCSYLLMVSARLYLAILILFWASRWVIPSVLMPSMATMTSPGTRLHCAALLPGVIY